MSSAGFDERPAIAWGWTGRALEHASGDLHVVVPFPGGALVALLDGLGHGPEAAEAAAAAAPVLEAQPSAPVEVLVQRCHEALRRTRGAVMSVASFRTLDSSLTWVGVGNVDAVVLNDRGRRCEAMSLRGGVVGYQLPALRAATLRIFPDDVLIMTTDGIHAGFTTELALDDDPQLIAESVLARFAKGTDDAHAVVARYLGASP
jgi:negative regulator of sigma-B (phosphoserine phosphatase)